MIGVPSLDISEAEVDRQILASEGLVQSLVKEAGWYGGYDTEIEARSAKEQAMEARSMALLLRNDFERSYAPFFNQRKAVYEENYRYWQSQQWTDTDIANLLGDGIPPYISNIMKRQIDTLTGEQRSRECDWRAVGRSQEADSHAEFQNHYLRAVAQKNEWNRRKAIIFRDAVIGGGGVASSALDPADPKGNIKLERERFVEFMWHLETAKNGSLEDTKYLERIYWVPRTTLMWEFPYWAEGIQNLDGMMYANIYPWLDTLIRPQVRRTTGSGAGYDGAQFDPFTSRLYRQMLLKREFYNRRMQPRWRVSNGYTATHYDVDSQAQASYIYQQLCEIWRINQSAATGQDADQIIPRIAEPRFVQVPVVDQEIWIGDELVAVNRDNDNSPPYHFLIPEYNDGTITSYFEHGKDMQRLRNISMSVLHKKAASFKGKWAINMYYLGQNTSEAAVDRMMMDELKVFKFSNPDPEAVKRAFNYVPPANQDGAFINSLIEFTTNDINYNGGGLSAVGVQESAGESGRAVNARASQAAIATVNLMDELNYFDKEVGERVLYLQQFTDPNVAWRAINPDGRPEFMSMADAGIQDSEEQQYSVDVVEVLSSTTQREAELQRLTNVVSQLGPNSPLAAPTAMVMFKKMDMDKSDRDEIMQQVQAQQQFQQQMAERQQALAEQQQKMHEFDTIQRHQEEQKRLELEEMKIKQPAVSLALKGTDAPGLVATVVNEAYQDAGADPMGVLSDRALNDKYNLDVEGARQVQETALMTPAQKKIQAVKAANAASSGQEQRSAKDRNARKNK